MSIIINKEFYTDEEVELLAKEFLGLLKKKDREAVGSFNYYTFLRRSLTSFEIHKLCMCKYSRKCMIEESEAYWQGGN